jgi:RNA polymerase sigma-70 factor, ECF subfamily
MLSESTIRRLYDDHGKELYIYILRFLREREPAEEVLHDCFVNLIAYSGKYTVKEETVKSFLYSTAHNLSINYLKRSRSSLMENLDRADHIASSEDPAADAVTHELSDAIDEILDTLDDETKSIFFLKKELGKDIAEISLISGKSERTVRRKLQKALEEIERRLKKRGLMSLLFFFMTVIHCIVVL